LRNTVDKKNNLFCYLSQQPKRLQAFTSDLIFYLTWIIHELRLPQVWGAGYEAVVFHCECAATKQMGWYQLAWKV